MKKSGGGSEKIVLGIDTGGTYTDGVLMDYHSRRIISSAKSLTTRKDLTRGIRKVIEKLKIKSPERIALVGISSTLATNSIAEDKAREIGLILIGYDKDLVTTYDMESKFCTRRFQYFSGGHLHQGEEKAPLDLEGIKSWVTKNRKKVDAFAVSSYFSPLNPTHEERTREAIKEIVDLPVVMGSQMSTKLDSIKRATTASVNAALVAVMREFVEAVRKALRQKHIHAPLMIVKGDGSLMPYHDAAYRPVETILSGPSASAIGGHFLTGIDSALVIDVGGTTTDLALIKEGRMNVTEEGASIGNVDTAVKSASIRTTCLGCDSRISFDQAGNLTVGPDRVMPISRLAYQYPEVEHKLTSLKKKRKIAWKPTDLQYCFLAKNFTPDKLPKEQTVQRKVVEVLQEGPASLSRLLRKARVHHPVQLSLDPLIKKGIIEEAALTPTDLLHVTREMELWSRPAAKQAMRCFAFLNNRDPDAFAVEVMDHIVSRICHEAVVFLAGQSGLNSLPEKIADDWGRWFFERSQDGTDPLLEIAIKSRLPLIGIGAPAEAFLRRVSEKLGTRFVLPDHAAVANAAGAVAGSIMVEREALVYLQETEGSYTYQARIENTMQDFKESEEAQQWARGRARELAREAALEAGAIDPVVTITVKSEGSLKRVSAYAVGNPEMTGRQMTEDALPT
ncbi:MAG: hydantoinase/oxoprolinase family protein [bacterium]